MNWEYKCIAAARKDDVPLPDVLNDFGAEGWELVSTVLVDQDLLCTLKRPVPDYGSTE